MSDPLPGSDPLPTDEGSRSTPDVPRTVTAAGVLGLLSTGAYLVNAIPGDLWYWRPFVGVILPLVLAGLVVWLWVRPGRRRIGRVISQYVIALVCLQAGVVLGLPFLVASTVCLFQPSSKAYYKRLTII